jgi:hypothetical protein
MNDHPNVDRSIRAWLIAEAPESASQRLLDASRDRIQMTQQRRAWWPAWRFPIMNVYAKLGIGMAALAVVAVVGLNLLSSGNGQSVGGAVASPPATPSSAPSPSPSPTARALPPGALNAERYLVTRNGVPFSFVPPSTRWRSAGESIETGINTGSAPEGPDFAWINFRRIGTVATDPCAGEGAPVSGSTVDDLAAALRTIPGTTAQEPVDVTVGGLPGKLVTLTIDPDPPCPMEEFRLYGGRSLYPNTVNSIIRIWITEIEGQRWAIHADHSNLNEQNGQEIQQIVDSIEFE